MKKICYINVSSIRGGGQKQMYMLLKHLDRSAWMPFVCTQNDGPYWDKVKQLHIDEYDFAIRKVSFVTFVKLAKQIRKKRPDIIHTHGKGAGLYGRVIGYLLGIPVVHTFHGLHYMNYLSMLRRMYFYLEKTLSLLTKAHICVAFSEKKDVLRLKLAKKDKITVIPNGIDFDGVTNNIIDREERRRVLGVEIGNDTICIGTIARISPQKGLNFLIKGFAMAKKEIEGMKLLIVGGCSDQNRGYQEKYNNLIEEYGLSGSVHFLGERDDVQEILSCLDLYVSTALWEGLPLSLLEAIACRLPVVATNIPGNNDIIDDSTNGILIEPGSPVAIKNGIVDGLSLSKKKLRNTTDSAYERLCSNFSAEVMAQKTFSIYEKVLSGR